jgi:hypothetical protein
MEITPCSKLFRSPGNVFDCAEPHQDGKKQSQRDCPRVQRDLVRLLSRFAVFCCHITSTPRIESCTLPVKSKKPTHRLVSGLLKKNWELGLWEDARQTLCSRAATTTFAAHRHPHPAKLLHWRVQYFKASEGCQLCFFTLLNLLHYET